MPGFAGCSIFKSLRPAPAAVPAPHHVPVMRMAAPRPQLFEEGSLNQVEPAQTRLFRSIVVTLLLLDSGWHHIAADGKFLEMHGTFRNLDADLPVAFGIFGEGALV